MTDWNEETKAALGVWNCSCCDKPPAAGSKAPPLASKRKRSTELVRMAKSTFVLVPKYSVLGFVMLPLPPTSQLFARRFIFFQDNTPLPSVTNTSLLTPSSMGQVKV